MIERLTINSNDDLDKLFRSSLDKYYKARKKCHTLFLRQSNVWNDIFIQVKNYDDSKPLKMEYMRYQEQINSLYYLLQVFQVLDIKKINEEQIDIIKNKSEVKIYKENDILYLALLPQIRTLQELNSKIFHQIEQYCFDKEYTQDFMFSLYEKFVGKIGSKYSEDYNELIQIMEQQKELLDAVYFCINYDGEADLLEFIERSE